MSKTKPPIEGRVNVALGTDRIAELASLAKTVGTSRGAIARELIFNGLDRVKSGRITISAGVKITP
jgi:hypothetical protein